MTREGEGCGIAGPSCRTVRPCARTGAFAQAKDKHSARPVPLARTRRADLHCGDPSTALDDDRLALEAKESQRFPLIVRQSDALRP